MQPQVPRIQHRSWLYSKNFIGNKVEFKIFLKNFGQNLSLYQHDREGFYSYGHLLNLTWVHKNCHP